MKNWNSGEICSLAAGAVACWLFGCWSWSDGCWPWSCKFGFSANGFVPRAAISSSSRHVHRPQQHRHPECSPQYAVWQFLRVSTDSSSDAQQHLEYHRQQLIPQLVKLFLRFFTRIAVINAEKRTFSIE